jgi:signal transduction histidine kinase/ActR/RegA family two-component response regulator
LALDPGFRQLVEDLPSGVVVTDLEGVVLYLNPACEVIFNRSRSGLVGQMLGLPVELGRHLEVNSFRLHHEPGTTLLEASKIMWEGKEARLCYFHDITSLKKAEAERLALESEVQHLVRMESIGRLASGIAHDMNNVLAAIMGLAQLDQEMGGVVAKHAGTILQAALRGRNLIKSLMDFSRKEIQESESLDLNALVEKEVELLQGTTMKKVSIRVDLAPNLPRMKGSITAISTALMNLCVNALDAMPEGGTLTLRTAQLSDLELGLEVEDTGNGMSQEVLDRALEPFYTTKAAGKGTGLGLSIVYGTVRAHGGNIRIQSQPGKGTQVRISLPVGEGGLQGHPMEPAQTVVTEFGHLRTLLVDDDALIRESSPALLKAMGLSVTVASGGQEALWLVGNGSAWDLMVLDLNMPDMDGLETLKRLRAMNSQLPVIVASGYAEEFVIERLRKLGRVLFISKPFVVGEIRAAIQELLGTEERRGARRHACG